MIHDELALIAEQVGEGLAAVRAVKHIRLLDYHPWHVAAFGAERVAGVGEFLLLGEQRLARR